MGKDSLGNIPVVYRINEMGLQADTMQPVLYGLTFMGGLVIGGILVKYYLAWRLHG